MEFRLERMSNDNNYLDYDVLDAGTLTNQAIQALTDSIDDTTYHELCHQLHGTKAEFDGQDDGEAHVQGDKKFYAVQSALYRGIFWKTLKALDNLDELADQIASKL